MENWPKISIITPSYNQAQFIEATILSVLNQNYPNLEYIIIDGGSTDGSVEIIQKYAARLTYWVSEEDRGQSHAINKGFQRATGQILCWLNSDDVFLPETLRIVAETLADNTGNYALVGHCRVVYADGRPDGLLRGSYQNRLRLLQFWKGYHMHQPAIFWRREVYEKVGLLDETLHLIMDFDYWARIAGYYSFKNLDVLLASANYHDAAKTGDGYKKYHEDLRRYNSRYWGTPFASGYWIMLFSVTIEAMRSSCLRPLKRFAKRMMSKPAGVPEH